MSDDFDLIGSAPEVSPLLDGWELGYRAGYEDAMLRAFPEALEKAYRVMHERMVEAYGEEYIPKTAYLADIQEEDDERKAA